MNMNTVRDKHFRLDQRKLEEARRILGAKTETETIEKALDMLIQKTVSAEERRRVVGRILERREKLGVVAKDVADWIAEGRQERDRRYAR
jgi:hypothetical protein